MGEVAGPKAAQGHPCCCGRTMQQEGKGHLSWGVRQEAVERCCPVWVGRWSQVWGSRGKCKPKAEVGRKGRRDGRARLQASQEAPGRQQLTGAVRGHLDMAPMSLQSSWVGVGVEVCLQH